MTALVQALATVAMVPLLALPLIVVLALLVGAIRPTGLWCDSFDPTRVSPTRITQFIFALVAAAAALIGLARSGGTAFADLPPWLVAVAGGGNLIYLGAKWTAARRTTAGGSK